MPRNTSPHSKAEILQLGGDDTQPTDGRDGVPYEDRCALPKIPVVPQIDEPEDALKKGGSKHHEGNPGVHY